MASMNGSNKYKIPSQKIRLDLALYQVMEMKIKSKIHIMMKMINQNQNNAVNITPLIKYFKIYLSKSQKKKEHQRNPN
jgi:hypothetical protein